MKCEGNEANGSTSICSQTCHRPGRDNERKVALIVSDGGDNPSLYTLKEVWPIVREAGVQIYALGIFDEAPKTNGRACRARYTPCRDWCHRR
jgi:hypothetical protein